MWEQLKRLFENEVLVALGALWACITTFILPTETIAASVTGVLIIMCLDLVTKLYSLAKISGGFRKAFRLRRITSNKFAKGTLDKLILLGVMLVIIGCAYNILLMKDIAIWFSQIVFSIMFLRDALSILENLNDAGIQGLGIFKKLLKRKLDEICDEDKEEKK